MVNNISTAYNPAWDEKSFLNEVEIHAEKGYPDFSQTLNMAFIGKVSCGKSSLVNALLRKERGDNIAKVGAKAGVTTKREPWKLDDHVTLMDSPGLDDVHVKNSKVTKKFLENIDVGVLVVTGALDQAQKKHLDDLHARKCNSIFVVLNKIDEWDRLKRSALESVIDQWKSGLQIDKIYPVCAFGYDPETAPNVPLDLRGVDQLRGDIEIFLDEQGKDLLLARQMDKKQSSATKIIVSALVAVAGQVFLPGSAAFIVATQASAIASLYYLYNGKLLDPKAAISLLPYFASESIVPDVFLFVQSFIPPTGVIDLAAAVTAVITTFAILATVNYLLATGVEITERQRLKEVFSQYKTQATQEVFFKVDFEMLKNYDYIQQTVKGLLISQAIA